MIKKEKKEKNKTLVFHTHVNVNPSTLMCSQVPLSQT